MPLSFDCLVFIFDWDLSHNGSPEELTGVREHAGDLSTVDMSHSGTSSEHFSTLLPRCLMFGSPTNLVQWKFIYLSFLATFDL
jgi:hypothetical protein